MEWKVRCVSFHGEMEVCVRLKMEGKREVERKMGMERENENEMCHK